MYASEWTDMGRLAFYLPVAGFLALALLLWRGLFLDTKERLDVY